MYLPHNIAELVGGLSFDENTVGMSDSRVFTFPDMVLKVEKHTAEEIDDMIRREEFPQTDHILAWMLWKNKEDHP